MILYQFKKINENVLDNIRKRQIWLSSPHKFNDPFDTIIRLGNELDEKIFHLCIDFYNDNIANGDRLEYHECLFLFPSVDGEEGDSPFPSFSESINFVLRGRPEFQIPLLNKIKGQVGNDSYAVISYLSVYSDIGVSCFSTAWYEPVMWAYYADNHQGICIKYEIDETSFDPTLRLIPVSYDDNIPDYAFATSDTALDSSVIEKQIGNKSTPWSYENEYRIVSKNICEGAIPIPGEIVSICTGIKTTKENKEKVFEAVGNESKILLGNISKSSDYRKFDWACLRPPSSKLDFMYYSPKLEKGH